MSGQSSPRAFPNPKNRQSINALAYDELRNKPSSNSRKSLAIGSSKRKSIAALAYSNLSPEDVLNQLEKKPLSAKLGEWKWQLIAAGSAIFLISIILIATSGSDPTGLVFEGQYPDLGDGTEPWHSSWKLSPRVVPSQYRLTMHPDFPTHRFSGSVEITVDVKAPRKDVDAATDDGALKNVYLHSLDLDINDVYMVSEENYVKMQAAASQEEADEARTRPLSYFLTEQGAWKERDNQFLVLAFDDKDKAITAGKWYIYINFSGNLADDLVGFYRSTYAECPLEAQDVGVTGHCKQVRQCVRVCVHVCVCVRARLLALCVCVRCVSVSVSASVYVYCLREAQESV
jgi:hypothetical protein